MFTYLRYQACHVTRSVRNLHISARHNFKTRCTKQYVASIFMFLFFFFFLVFFLFCLFVFFFFCLFVVVFFVFFFVFFFFFCFFNFIWKRVALIVKRKKKMNASTYNKKFNGFVWKYIFRESLFGHFVGSAKTIRPHEIYLHANPISYNYTA